MNLRTAFDFRYRRSVRIGVVWVLLLGVAASLTLDMGEAARVYECALAAYGILLLILFLRRPTRPTPADLLVVSWSFPVLIIAVVVVSYCLQHWREMR